MLSPGEIQVIIGLGSAIFGGTALKFIDIFYNKGVSKDNLATQLRSELREDAQDLQKRVDSLTDEVDEWKSRYYNVLDGFYQLRKELFDAGVISTTTLNPLVEKKKE